MADGRCLDMSAVDILKATQQGIEPVGADADEVHIGATWRIRLSHPFAAAMRLFVKLL